jgi:hypothetical protein
VAVLAGSVWLWRRGRRGVVVTLLAPMAVALLAAVLRRYPYGGEARQMQFAAPAICLLAGLGAAWLLSAIPHQRARRGLAALALFCLAAFAVFSVRSDLKRPYRFPYDHQVREFARRFWPEQARAAELACLYADFGVAHRDRRHQLLRTPLYLCNQWIYSPQRRRNQGPRWDAISPRRPLRCVLYDETSPDYPGVLAWQARMERSFELRRIDRVEVATTSTRSEHVVVFEFVPRPGTAMDSPPAIAGQGLRTVRFHR